MRTEAETLRMKTCVSQIGKPFRVKNRVFEPTSVFDIRKIKTSICRKCSFGSMEENDCNNVCCFPESRLDNSSVYFIEVN